MIPFVERGLNRHSHEPGGQSLDGDVAAELAVVRPIDFAHAAGA
jgi:hypothetical protein